MISKKRGFKFLFLFILAIAAYLVFSPARRGRQITAILPLFRTIEQLENPALLTRWWYPFAHAPASAYQVSSDPAGIKNENSQVLIRKLSPYTFSLTAREGSDSNRYYLQFSPDTANSVTTIIKMSYLTKTGGRLFRQELDQLAEKSLSRLDSIVNIPALLYGYPINIIKVTDSSFLFKSVVSARNNEARSTAKLYDELINYADKRHAGYNGVRIFYSQPVSKDSIELFAGIGVTVYTPTNPEDDIQYKMMPYGKKLLALEYEGTYGNSRKMFDILEQFKRDHNMVSMAIPFQKFLTNGYGFSDSQIVRTRVCYPVL